MEISGAQAAGAERMQVAGAERMQVAGAERMQVAGAERMQVAGAERTRVTGAERTLASGVAAGLERLIGLFRSLSPPDGLSLTAAATLATLERSGPRRLTGLAAQEGVTQPAMTQLIARLQDSGLVGRDADPADGRVVQVRLTEAGREMLARRRAVRADRLAVILARISPQDQAALAAALPAIDALTSTQRNGGVLAASSPGALTAAPGTDETARPKESPR